MSDNDYLPVALTTTLATTSSSPSQTLSILAGRPRGMVRTGWGPVHDQRHNCSENKLQPYCCFSLAWNRYRGPRSNTEATHWELLWQPQGPSNQAHYSFHYGSSSTLKSSATVSQLSMQQLLGDKAASTITPSSVSSFSSACLAIFIWSLLQPQIQSACHTCW